MEPVPPAVASLLATNTTDAKDRAWSEFLDQYSRLLLSASRRVGATHDETMDHYAFVLDRLREDDFRRLRVFTANGAGKFTTWLVVVAKRLSIDQHRQTHGRADTSEDDVELIARRNLADHVVQELDWDQVAHTGPNPDQAFVCSICITKIQIPFSLSSAWSIGIVKGICPTVPRQRLSPELCIQLSPRPTHAWGGMS